jgi:lipopolysaccharide transport system ATP-binding protein
MSDRDVVIRVENISKLYRLGEVGTGSLAHDVNRWWHRVRGKEDPYLKIGEVNDRTKPAARVGAKEIEDRRSEIGGGEAGEKHSVILKNVGINSDGAEGASALATSYSPLVTPKAPPSDWVYALKDVSFEVKRGEVLGIIGRNGAGKSTLLKILSRVTTQTSGSIKVKGRIASLLEVGTGFHPELTGRENIFLNGAILGMRKAEIARKFDEIVEFSGCARYIDTPVKRYSSGMYVRLAFAVAAHLEPEILIVDEVLAVGDAEFQKKCLGKMKDVAGHGRTILFVSHNMAAVKSLCDRAILLQNGMKFSEGSAIDICDSYNSLAAESKKLLSDQRWDDFEDAPGNESIKLHRLSIHPTINSHISYINMSDSINVVIEYWKLNKSVDLGLGIEVSTVDGVEVFEDWTTGVPSLKDSQNSSLIRTTCEIPGKLLNSGNFNIRLVFFDKSEVKIITDFKDVSRLEIIDNKPRDIMWHGKFKGFFHPELKWKSELL